MHLYLFTHKRIASTTSAIRRRTYTHTHKHTHTHRHANTTIHAHIIVIFSHLKRSQADYTPQRMDYVKLKEGDLIQLMNLIPLSNSKFALTAVDVKGVLGWQSLLNQIYLIWYTDLSAHIRAYASGITPIRSLGNVCALFLFLSHMHICTCLALSPVCTRVLPTYASCCCCS